MQCVNLDSIWSYLMPPTLSPQKKTSDKKIFWKLGGFEYDNTGTYY